jgi:tetratricopeptide (TPR) repeat protein
LAEDSLEAFKAAADPAGIAGALSTLGMVTWHSGDPTEGRGLIERALRVRRELGDARGVSGCLIALAGIAQAAGDPGTARRYLEEALELARESGHKREIAHALDGLGVAAVEQGDDAAALAFLRQALSIERELGAPVGWPLRNAGNLARLAGDLQLARELLEECLADFRREGSRWGVLTALTNLALVLAMQGKCARARARLEEALGIAVAADKGLAIIACLEAFAFLAGSVGNPERGVRLLGAAEALREELGAPTPVVRVIQREVALSRAVTRGDLDDEAYQAAHAAGRAMDREQAIAYALERGDTPDDPA